MKHLAKIEWDMNTRSNEAKIMDGKSARELTPEEKYAKIFT